MRNKFPMTLAVALLPFAAPLTALAEDGETGGARLAEFTCASLDDPPPQGLFYRQGSEYLPLGLTAGQRSQVYPLKGAGMLELFIRKGDPSVEPGDYEKAGTAPLPEGAKRVLFLIEAKNDANGLPLQLLGMDDSLEAFPAGSFRFINLTPDLLRIELGETACELPPGAVKVVFPKIPEAGGFLPAIIKDAEGRNLLENRFLSQRASREMVIIRPPAEGRIGLMMNFLSESIPAIPPAGKKPGSEDKP